MVTWMLEADVFASGDDDLRRAIEAHGDELRTFCDDWWLDRRFPQLEGPVVLRLSLGNCVRARRELPFRPGAFCDVEALHCSAYYPGAAPWLVHRSYVVTTVRELVADPGTTLAPISSPERFFVRPDGPQKAFAGRVVARDGLSLQALDHGFYYDDEDLPVVAAPLRQIGREWRYVVVDGQVVAGSAYLAEGRAAQRDDPTGAPWQRAQEIATNMPAPERVYVLDLCEADGALWLIECNPFSGADLYACDPAGIVAAVDRVATELA